MDYAVQLLYRMVLVMQICRHGINVATICQRRMYHWQFSEMYFDLLNRARINTVKQLYRYGEEQKTAQKRFLCLCEVSVVFLLHWREQIVIFFLAYQWIFNGSLANEYYIRWIQFYVTFFTYFIDNLYYCNEELVPIYFYLLVPNFELIDAHLVGSHYWQQIV